MQTWWRCQCVDHSAVCLPANPTVAPVTFLPLSRRHHHQQHREAPEITVQMASHWALTFVQQRDAEPVTTTADKGRWDRGYPRGRLLLPWGTPASANLQPQTFHSSSKGRLMVQNSLSNNDTLLETEQTLEERLVLTFKTFLSSLTHLPSGFVQFVQRHTDSNSPNPDCCLFAV